MSRTSEEFLKEQESEALRIVADHTMFFEEVVQDYTIAKFLQVRDVDYDRLGALCTIALGDFRGNGPTIGYHPIDDSFLGMTLDRP